MKRTRQKYYVGSTALAMLGLLVMMSLCPCVSRVEAISTEAPRDEATFSTKIYANAAISLAVQNRANIEIIPRSDGDFSATKADVRVATNSRDGYTVFLRTVDSEGKLRNVNDTTVGDTVDPVAGENLTEAEMGANTWGYSTDGERYSGASSTDQMIFTADKAVDKEDYELYIGAKVDMALTAGVYAGEVVVSAVANPMTITSLTALKDMQGMNADICAATPAYVSVNNYATAQLVDLRDGKTYWVGKLADGKCWMQQNLALELDVDVDGDAVAVAKNGGRVKLTNGNTNISTATWSNKDSNVLPPSKTTYSTSSTLADKTTYSWSMKSNVLLVNPANAINCANDGYILAQNETLNTIITKCPTYFKEVEPEMLDTMEATESSTSNGVAYDAHYLLGNWYSWYAAVAGYGKQLSGENTDSGKSSATSICPAGWRLPTNAEQIALMEAYNIKVDGANAVGVPWVKNAAALKQSVVAPIYVVYAGNIADYYNNSGYGGYLTNTAYVGGTAYYAYFSAVTIYPTNGVARSAGLSVRCVAE